MSVFCCDCKRSCTALAIIVSAIVGIVAAFLQILSVITVAPAFLWVAFGIAVAYLTILLARAPSVHRASACRSVCPILSALLIGSLGTILLALILLAVAATGIFGAILTGLLLFFFALLLTSTACFTKCLASCSD